MLDTPNPVLAIRPNVSWPEQVLLTRPDCDPGEQTSSVSGLDDNSDTSAVSSIKSLRPADKKSESGSDSLEKVPPLPAKKGAQVNRMPFAGRTEQLPLASREGVQYLTTIQLHIEAA